MNRSEFLDILEKCLERSASRREQARLADAVRVSPGRLDFACRAVRDELLLRSMARDAAAFADSAMEAITRSTGTSDFVEETMQRLQPGGVAGRRAMWGRGVRVWLSAAAALVAVIGLSAAISFRIREAGRPALHVTKFGDVTVSGDEIVTGPRSYCRVEFKDGTIMAMDEESRVSAVAGTGGQGKRIGHTQGRVYLDVRKQKVPAVVDVGGAQLQVLGTRVLTQCAAGRPPVADILEGRGLFQLGNSSAVLERGQSATTLGAWISVARFPIAPDALGWLAGMDIDAAEVRRRAWSVPPSWDPPCPDLLDYVVTAGRWHVAIEDGKIVVRQEDPSAGLISNIDFGDSTWKKGILSFRFKMLQRSGSPAHVNAVFRHREGRDLLGAAVLPLPGNEKEPWYCARVPFEIGDKNDLISRGFTFWTDALPDKKFTRDFMKHPDNSEIKKRDLCSVGLFTENCAVEFRDITLTGTGSLREEQRAVRWPRERLLALYLFRDGAGDTVRNVLRRDGALDMKIGDPSKVRWTGYGLDLNGAAKIVLDDKSGALADAWKKSGGLAYEIWMQAPDDVPWHNGVVLTRLLGDRYRFDWIIDASSCRYPGHMKHFAETIQDVSLPEGARMRGVFYSNGRPARDRNDFAAMGPWISKRNNRWILAPDPSRADGQHPVPEGTRICAMAIYDRVLTPAEVRASFDAGLPEAGGAP